MKKVLFLLVATVIAMSFGSCVSTHSSIASTMPEIQLKPEHLEVTAPMEATAVTTRIIGVDWERLFSKRTATIRGTVYSSIVSFDKTDEYAIFNLLRQNEGYDMVLYPKFERVERKPVLGIGMIYSVTEVKVSARMAKLKF